MDTEVCDLPYTSMTPFPMISPLPLSRLLSKNDTTRVQGAAIFRVIYKLILLDLVIKHLNSRDLHSFHNVR